MVPFEPVERVADEEAPDFPPPVVEDQAVPVGVESLAGVLMLVEMGPVEVAEAVLVGGKVRRNPVHDHPDPVPVQGIDQRHQVLRGAVAPRRGEIAGGLVAPRPVERMLGEGQELDVGKAHLEHVRHQLIGQLPIGEPSIPVVRHPAPGAEMHLVDRHRRPGHDALPPRRHPLVVLPLVVEIPDDRGLTGRLLGAEADRVRLVDPIAPMPRHDVVLVSRPPVHVRQKPGPDSGGADRRQDVAILVPLVEVAHHAHPLGARGPDREAGPRASVDDVRMGAELLVHPEVGALVEEMDVVLGEHERRGRRGRRRGGGSGLPGGGGLPFGHRSIPSRGVGLRPARAGAEG